MTMRFAPQNDFWGRLFTTSCFLVEQLSKAAARKPRAIKSKHDERTRLEWDRQPDE